MNNSDAFTQLMTQYQTLRQYCDNVFTSTLDACRGHMQCAKGCASCCILETVTPLEAHVIQNYLQSVPTHTFSNIQEDEGTCVFLRDNVCSIYAVRPIICRTHGLPLLYPERGEIEVCPLNFTELDLTALDPAYFFDAERITANLMRLNLAFCMLTGNAEDSRARVFLQDILMRNA